MGKFFIGEGIGKSEMISQTGFRNAQGVRLRKSEIISLFDILTMTRGQNMGKRRLAAKV